MYKRTNENPDIGGVVNGGYEIGTETTYKGGKETSSIVDIQEAVPQDQRDQWTNPTEFLLSCISMSVGIGNFYRFPFTAYENGGGAFSIPYLVVLFLIGKPIYFLELALGQFCSYGQVKCWKMAPLFKGVGYGSALGSFCVVTYYASIMALTVFYFFASFQSVLPWTKCNPLWAGNETCAAWDNYTASKESPDLSPPPQYQKPATEKPPPRINLAELYFENEVLKQKENINDGIGYPEWRLSLCLLLSWLAVFFSLVKGVKSSGKVAYFTALYPYVVLLILLIHGLTKEGAISGIKYFITPVWRKVIEPSVWYAAVSQCFFSLSTGFGPIIMYASYNPFRHNVYRDAIIVSLTDTFTSLFAGFTVFAILGNLAHELDIEVSEVAKSGPGLIFVSYADAISKFDWVPQLFAVIFFLMLFSLGVGSAVSWQMAIITVICDQFPKLNKKIVTGVSCGVCFLVGLVYLTPGGQFILTLVDSFGGNFTIYVLTTLEVFGIAWVYGLNNFIRDIEFMLERKIGWFWRVSWGYFVPITLSVIFVYSMVKYENITYNDTEYPIIAIVCGWILAGVILILVPICALHAVMSCRGSNLKEKLKRSVCPTDDWGPKDPTIKQQWEIYKLK